jgi:hypothetical protein
MLLTYLFTVLTAGTINNLRGPSSPEIPEI